MVKILSNGDIVQDDDPRAQQSAGSRGSSSARPRQVLISYIVLVQSDKAIIKDFFI